MRVVESGSGSLKLLFALPGFHRYARGAEVALLSVATELAQGQDEITVVGSGKPLPNVPYVYRSLPSIRRERFEAFPKFPPMRSETAWEDATFAMNLVLREPLSTYDATITCSFPFTHWALRRGRSSGPAHIFVTQNGDWPAFSDRSEFRFFGCEGLVCTNPDYLDRNQQRWRCALIPNGVDSKRFQPGPSSRERFGLPFDKPVVLMVSAFVESKRVLDGIRAIAEIDDVFLAIAGDGPLRQEARKLADELLPERYLQFTLPAQDMPSLYRSADVFLHLSLLESFGNVFLEAWASGLPIVANDSDRLRWILGNAQFLCNTENRSALVSSLTAALMAGKSAAPQGIKRFTWTSIARQYRDFIADVIASR